MAARAGWFIAGTAPARYDTSTAPSDRGGGTACELRSVREAPPGFGTLMQEFVPEGYRGRRVRLTAWLRSEGVSEWCGLWMRVDGPARRMLAFDNMSARPIRGTTGWARYVVVLDVAAEAEVVAFGVILNGEGSVAVDEVALEVVGDEVATTDHGVPAAPSRAAQPGLRVGRQRRGLKPRRRRVTSERCRTARRGCEHRGRRAPW
jgi:hypothetical protein